MSDNTNLNLAGKVKNNEFYTRYKDIQEELQHYPKFFKDKIVYCNCDDPTSNFVKYFLNNFEQLQLKKLGLPFFKWEKAEKEGKRSV